MSDLGIAVRSLARRPGLALGVAVTLGLGVGATTTVYAVVDGVLLRPLPYDEVGALVTIGSYSRLGGALASGVLDLGPITIRHYQNLRERAGSFESLAAVDVERLLSPSAGLGPRIVTHAVSAELLEMLGAATPAAGRAFLPEEYEIEFNPRLNARRAVMITYDAWQRRFGGDPGVIGRPLGANSEGPTLVGVLPREFRPLEAFTGTGATPEFYYAGWADTAPPDRGQEPIYVLGRLRLGVTVEQARDEVERLSTELSSESPELTGAPIPAGVRIGLNGLQAQTVGAGSRQLGLFLSASALLLVLATMNAAMLLLVRALDRGQELSVRVALGAGRSRVLRLLMTESSILALAGGALGVLLADAGVGGFRRFAPASIARLGEVAIDARVLVVAALVALGTGVAVGVLPALRVTRRSPWTRMHGSGRSATEGSRTRSALVAGQMAVAIVLLSGSGLLFNSFVRMRTLDPGFRPDGLVTAMVPYKDAAAVAGLSNSEAWDLVLERMAALPGVESVGGTTSLPFERSFMRVSLESSGSASTADAVDGRVAAYAITPGYLETMGTALLDGRDVVRADGPDAGRVALVNESFVRAVLGGADPVGQVLRLADGDGEFRVVGVVEDVVQLRAEEGFRPAIYFSYAQVSPMAGVQVVVRSALPAEIVAPEVRRVAAAVTGLSDLAATTMVERMAQTRASPRFEALLVSAFALVSLLLAAVGLHGSLAYSVGRRQRELGLRMALGAGRAGVLGMVVKQGMRVAAAGLAVGMIATLASARAIAGFLFEVQPTDPATLVAVSAALMLVSALACLGPARRATAVDPIEVLRAD